MKGQPLSTSHYRVRFFDLDLSTTVFFINHIKWLDSIAGDDFFQSRGISWSELFGKKIDMAIANVNFDYKSPLFINDLVDIRVEEVVIGNKSMQMCGSLYRHETDDLVATGKIVYVFVDAESRRPLPVPQEVRDKIAG